MITNDDLKYFKPYLFRENIFPHQIFQKKSELAYMHYTMPSAKFKNSNGDMEFVKKTPQGSKEEIFKWLNFLADNPFGSTIRDYVAAQWEVVEKELADFASFNVHVEGNIPQHDIFKTKLFTHYHPPREDNGVSLTFTSITPLILNNQINERLVYSDYNQIGFKPKTHREIFKDCVHRSDFAKALSREYLDSDKPGLEWSELEFPKSGTLRLKFDGARYPHYVSNESNNVFIVLVFNDVHFNDMADLQKSDFFHYEYL